MNPKWKSAAAAPPGGRLRGILRQRSNRKVHEVVAREDPATYTRMGSRPEGRSNDGGGGGGSFGAVPGVVLHNDAASVADTGSRDEHDGSARSHNRDPADADSEAATELHPVRVLLADADPLSRRVGAILFAMASAQCETVADGRAVLERLAADPGCADVVLVDTRYGNGGGDCTGAAVLLQVEKAFAKVGRACPLLILMLDDAEAGASASSISLGGAVSPAQNSSSQASVDGSGPVAAPHAALPVAAAPATLETRSTAAVPQEPGQRRKIYPNGGGEEPLLATGTVVSGSLTEQHSSAALECSASPVPGAACMPPTAEASASAAPAGTRRFRTLQKPLTLPSAQAVIAIVWARRAAAAQPSPRAVSAASGVSASETPGMRLF